MFVCTAAFSFLVERTLYRPLYRATHLKQVLLTVGIIFVAVAATCGWGPQQQPVIVPDSLSGQVPVLGLELSRYRLLLIAVGIAVTLALVFGLERTLRRAHPASVDRQRTAEAMGIHVGRVFQLTLAIGCGLAGLGGALGVNVSARPVFPAQDPRLFPAGRGRRWRGIGAGTLLAALLLGVADTAGVLPPKPARSSSTRPWWCCCCCSRTGCWRRRLA